MPIEMFECQACGKITVGRMPKHGDGTFYYPRKHKGEDGNTCEGVYDEAISVQMDHSTTKKVKDL
jgi:cytochrome c5